MKKLSLVLMLFASIFFSSCEEEVEIVQIKTDFGEMLVYLYDATPGHKANFMKLAKEGFYDGTTFHRIIQNFMIQGGDPNSKDNDPNNDGQGGPAYTGAEGTFPSHDGKSYTIAAEIKPDFKHKYGSIAAARMGDNVNPEKRSSGSQFYIVVNKNGTPHLDNNYTVFGEVVSGMEVAEKIVSQPKNQMDRPTKDIKMDINIIKVKPSQLDKKYKWKMPEHK
jgi:cyclophilin family peptidyl-prolyl cis-trans isomerase